MPAECLVQLGEHLVLQFIASSEGPRRRLLPRTPGQELNEAPPSKPTRTQSSVSQLLLWLSGLYHLHTLIAATAGEDGDNRQWWQLPSLYWGRARPRYVMLEAGSSIEPTLALFLGLRERLKRIAREVNSRDSKVGRSKPPPVSKGENAFLWIHIMHLWCT